MERYKLDSEIKSFDERRFFIIPGDKDQTIDYCAKRWVKNAQEAISVKGSFFVALSGGSTPNAIYKKLSESGYKEQVDWTKVWLFWGDERAVPPTDSESNFFSAMKSGFEGLPIPKEQIFRMRAEPEKDIENSAKEYDKIIHEHLREGQFDLVMLGMGEDGHTASLFPRTHALHSNIGRFCVANYVPEKKVWRMTLTYECINAAKNICLYVLGNGKADVVVKALLGDYDPDNIPIQKIGTASNKALWILDTEAAIHLKRYFS